MDHKQVLIGLLGLEATATDEVIANSIASFQREAAEYKDRLDTEAEALRNRVAELEAENTASKTEVTNLQNTANGLREELVNRDMKEYADVIGDKPEEVKEQLLANREGTLKILNSVRKRIAAPAAPLHDPNQAVPPGSLTNRDAKAEARARRISNRARAIMNEQKLPWGMAFQAAQAEESEPAAAAA